MVKIFLILLLSVCGMTGFCADWFSSASEAELPLEVKVIEHRTADNITMTRFFFTSQKEDGEIFRIYAVYAAPVAPGKYPALLHLHGGGQTADPELVKRWAARGYACLSFDWTGNPEKKCTGKREFSSFGKMTEPSHNDAMFPEKIETARVRLIQLASRRALLWLNRQPTADPACLGVIGISWGGFSSLLLGETIPGI